VIRAASDGTATSSDEPQAVPPIGTARGLPFCIGSFPPTGIFLQEDAITRLNPDLLTKAWSASWIAVPDASPFHYGVYHFRRTFELPSTPSSFIVHVTADNRYQLFANGKRIVWGPARGDLNHWRFETVDVAPHLKAGRNVLAAIVWNFGEHAPESQVTHRTAFLLLGNTAAERMLDTNGQWTPLARNQDRLEAQVRLPERITGDFVWRGARRPLHAGLNTLSFKLAAVDL
jgi:hypothetical protein